MGFIHHTTGAAGATGLMAESVRLQGHPCFAPSGIPVTDLTGPSISATRIGGRPFCHAGRAATPIPVPRIRTVKGQDH